MTKGSTVLNITQHIILKNGWEYYVTDNKHSADIVCCLVYGQETELGDVSLNEIKPYIVSRTRELAEVMPCPDWRWIS